MTPEWASFFDGKWGGKDARKKRWGAEEVQKRFLKKQKGTVTGGTTLKVHIVTNLPPNKPRDKVNRKIFFWLGEVIKGTSNRSGGV